MALLDVGNFLQISRQWNSNDEIAIELPISIRTEAIKGTLMLYTKQNSDSNHMMISYLITCKTLFFFIIDILIIIFR